ncbi:hypothetical protein E2562_033705 [Oryza meyeriana var. granulata]|uniref:rRNA N-glycosylase n=1 Tax=Oryza meyeriana var. granulata TaxID=110450 RepID=A0A6G1DRV3_9ORYZ|nr:hypothetical protein E2562_033705 [Oryza meyeriana var. granulata]
MQHELADSHQSLLSTAPRTWPTHSLLRNGREDTLFDVPELLLPSKVGSRRADRLFDHALPSRHLPLLPPRPRGYRSDVLSVPKLDPPSDNLFVVGLNGGVDGDEIAAVALQGHDLSLAGFTNRTHHWHAFRGREGLIPTAASVLPFGDNYRDLIGGIENLPGVPLGWASMVQAARVLSSYDPLAWWRPRPPATTKTWRSGGRWRR